MVSSERMITFSGSECRWSTQARIESGAVSFPRFMKTAGAGHAWDRRIRWCGAP